MLRFRVPGVQSKAHLPAWHSQSKPLLAFRYIFPERVCTSGLVRLLTGTELLSLLSDFHPLVFSAAEWKNSAKDANRKRDVFWGVWHVPLTMKNLAHLTLEGIERRELRWIGSRFLDGPNIHVSPFPATLPSAPKSVVFFPFCSLRIPYNVFSSSSFLLGPTHPTLCPLSF